MVTMIKIWKQTNCVQRQTFLSRLWP